MKNNLSRALPVSIAAFALALPATAHAVSRHHVTAAPWTNVAGSMRAACDESTTCEVRRAAALADRGCRKRIRDYRLTHSRIRQGGCAAADTDDRADVSMTTANAN